jgi:hypothetical protein
MKADQEAIDLYESRIEKRDSYMIQYKDGIVYSEKKNLNY